MRILLVSSFLPYPLTSGGHIRLYNLIKELSKNHEITLVCEKRNYQREEDITKVKRICKEVYTLAREKQWSFRNILMSGFSGYPFLMTGHTSKQFRQIIEDVLRKEQFDVIHVETFYVMQNLPKTDIPVVLIEHNIEYLVYRRFVLQTPFFLRPFLLLDIKKMEHWEKIFWKRATKLVAVSELEKNQMDRKDVEIVSNGVDIKQFTFNSLQLTERERRVLFIGDFRWIQNRDAIKWILNEIWPKISQLTINSSQLTLKLWVVGKHIPDSIRKLTNDSSVIFDENAPENTPEIFKKSYFLLSPLRVGGGTSFKILEAMASGVVVVTTHLGIEGISATEKEALIGETTDELVLKVQNVLKDNKLYNSIAKNARELIEKEYDWKKIVLKLEKVYRSV